MTLAVLVTDAIILSASARGFVDIASNFIFVCFFGLIYGASTALVYGFILRQLMGWIRAALIWQWILAGSILVIPFFFAFRRVERFQDRISALPTLVVILIGGGLTDLTYDNRILLPAILAGAMTSAALFYVHRAFGQKAES
jgi:hypothetical protein